MDVGNPSGYASRDEVIEDSEGEIEYAKSFSAGTTNQQLHANAVSSISDFTTTAHGARSDEIELHSIADRAKTRQRTQATKKSPVFHDDVIELTSDEDAEKCTKSSAKSNKSKPKPKEKMPDKPLPAPSVTTNASHSEQPRPRPRPRPRPIKQAPAKLDSDPLPPHHYPFAQDPSVYDLPAKQPPPASTPPSCPGQPDLPIATSPAINNHITVPSQLPPSDPPNSTMTTAIRESDTLPPIEILQDGQSERGRETPDRRLSSPSSLFSDRGSRSKTKLKKRKREARPEIQDNEYEVDQLMPSSPGHPGETSHVNPPVLGAYTHGPEPPPTFFAGSSSSVSRPDGQRDMTPFSKPQVEVVDLTDLPPTLDCPKPNKPVKNKRLKAKANPEIDLGVEFGVDGDSDFNPSGRKTAKKRKGKGKEPMKENENKPKEKKQRTRKKKEQLDGAVVQSKATTTKTKEKKIEKEVFKSREIIDDSDEDPLLLVGDQRVEGKSLPPRDGMTSPKSSDLNQNGLSSPSSGKPFRSKPDEPSSTASVPTESKIKASIKGRKRKLILESDEEGPKNGNENQAEDCIVVKRRKPASNTVLSDEEVQQERVSDVRKNARSVKDKLEDQTSSRGSKTTVLDDEAEKTTLDSRQDETTQGRSVKVGQSTNVQKARKENIPGTLASPAVRPSASRASSMNPNTSTPLYARYEVAPRRSSLPMSELIRRASSKPGSPFAPPASVTPSGKRPDAAASTTPLSIMTYSPYLKMSRRALSRIAPLHLNRKTPPPPLPPPPPKKKSKKELEMEERWEEELVESVGGIEVWASMGDAERREMRRTKREMELVGYDD